jgi:hypothetical protein
LEPTNVEQWNVLHAHSATMSYAIKEKKSFARLKVGFSHTMKKVMAE